jgi:GNAT superfamily N-acetyltransferase
VTDSATARYEWRGDFDDDEVNDLWAEAFGWNHEGTRMRVVVLHEHSLGWVVSRDGDRLVGFVNVIWDGCLHAWIQDVMVATDVRRQGIGTGLVATARVAARDAGCEWLHVDFDDRLRPFYYDACGFSPTSAGLIQLQ